jgi:heptosyltransferase-2
MNPTAANADPAGEKILVRGVNWLGDAVMSIPALQRLREAKPHADITLLAPEKLAGLWQSQPFLDHVLLFSPADTLWQTARRLRAHQFSAAVAFPNSLRAALELWLAGIPRRTGYARPGRTVFLTHPVPARSGAVAMRKRSAGEVRRLIARAECPPPIPDSANHIHDYLGLVAALGASAEPLPPRMAISQEEIEETAARLGLPAARDDRPMLGMNPGAEYGPAKRWPVESFIAAGIAIHQATRCRWIIFGGPSDCDIAQQVAAGLAPHLDGPSVLNLARRTTLRELAAALQRCRLLLTNDSGPMHLAAAVGTPVVVPFGSTSPEMTGPILSPAAQILRAPGIPCAPCFRRDCPIDFRCMKNITSDAVVAAALRALHFNAGEEHDSARPR